MPPEILRTIVRHEGGVSSQAADKGGLTKYGISKQCYPDLSIRTLTLEDACRIYERDYYQPLRLDQIESARLRWKVFDIAVLCGKGKAATMLQRALDRLDNGVIDESVVDDGIIGPQTIEVANRLCVDKVLELLKDEMMLHFARICAKDPSQVIFLLGWTVRAIDTAEELPS